MKWLRPLLSVMALAAAYFWSRLLLPFCKEQVPFSGGGDGAGGSAATFQVPVMLFWLATMFAICFLRIKPHVRLENGLTRLGRWLANAALVPVAPILVRYVYAAVSAAVVGPREGVLLRPWSDHEKALERKELNPERPP